MIPAGVIVIWSGALVDVPDGWALCDGNNGTPDLRMRFVLPQGYGVPVGWTGGASSHDHTYSNGSHRHTIQVGPPHEIQSGSGYAGVTMFQGIAGTTASKEHLPPYYVLAYIQKL